MHRTLSRITATQPTVRFRSSPVATWASTGHADASEVSDSEPEREERRQEEKENRKRCKQHRRPNQCRSGVIALTGTQEPVLTQPVSQASQPPPATQSVISIQDDSSEHASDVGFPGKGLQTEHDQTCNAPVEGIIDISDVASDDPSMPSVHALLAKRMRSPEYEEPPIDITRPICDRSNSPCASTEASDSDGERRAGLNLKLKGFAYDGALNGKSRNPSSASASRSGSIVSVASAPKQTRATSKAKMTFAEEFTEADLARLLKCVSCELTWTTRKSVTQKLKHIQACAKKRSLTNSTVAFLLRSELAVLLPLPDKSAGAEKAKEPGTLLETWTDGTNKRRTKRRAVPDAVRSLSDTRGQILDRARALLGEPSWGQHGGAARTDEGPRIRNEDEGVQMPPPTQVFSESALAKNRQAQQESVQPIAFASTQQFAPSRLVASGTASSPTVETPEDDIDMPPPTQKFAPSRFAVASSNNRTLHEASKVPMPESTRKRSFSNISADGPYAY
ncbi:hypothetical protein DAEQUDRAFT_724152 [Daedalea quercina L-15889]|uniref:Uncharacterized protein n=1 Tax=Daedalea quercina L-15889 TaxID=1314783 RepID=A0A165S732_9APHY|nr:hypothetical protein DAEQUDRAFT_724152 [Daedalea quercina L-15889]